MIFLLNREFILYEIVELARLHMCEVLKVPPHAIEASVDLNPDNGRLSPQFQVDGELCKGVSKKDIRKVMSEVYADCRREMDERLGVCVYTRRAYLEKFVWDVSEEENKGREEATA